MLFTTIKLVAASRVFTLIYRTDSKYLDLKIEDLLGSYHKLIMDPVHGGIPVLEHEVKIIDHPLFQRLRFICQNDILSLVFPGATHSRFLHSVGAMHVGGRMFMALIENSLKAAPRDHNQGIPERSLEAISYFHRLIRCACLLHDSGHCSFSHQFSRTPAIRSLLAQKDRMTKLWASCEEEIPKQDYEGFLEHEHYSLRVAHAILDTCALDEQMPETRDILALMETSQVEPSEAFSRHAEAIWPILARARGLQDQPEHYLNGLRTLFSHLVSGELDADRADYMLRDGFHSSVTIGGFNLDHLLSNLHIGICAQTGWMGLAISEKGLGSLEDFVYSRHQMYRQVYAHKTAQGFDWLLRAAIDEVMNEPETLNFVDRCLSHLEGFKRLTDNYFWEAFRRYADKHPTSYSACILDRVRMPYLASRLNLSEQEESTYTDFLTREHELPDNCIATSSITARFTKIQDDFEDIKVLSRDPFKRDETFKRVAHTSQFFAKFSDDRITHFYIDPVKIKSTQ